MASTLPSKEDSKEELEQLIRQRKEKPRTLAKRLSASSYDKDRELCKLLSQYAVDELTKELRVMKALSQIYLNAYVTILLQNQPFAATGCSSCFLTVPKGENPLKWQKPRRLISGYKDTFGKPPYDCAQELEAFDKAVTDDWSRARYDRIRKKWMGYLKASNLKLLPSTQETKQSIQQLRLALDDESIPLSSKKIREVQAYLNRIEGQENITFSVVTIKLPETLFAGSNKLSKQEEISCHWRIAQQVTLPEPKGPSAPVTGPGGLELAPKTLEPLKLAPPHEADIDLTLSQKNREFIFRGRLSFAELPLPKGDIPAGVVQFGLECKEVKHGKRTVRVELKADLVVPDFPDWSTLPLQPEPRGEPKP